MSKVRYNLFGFICQHILLEYFIGFAKSYMFHYFRSFEQETEEGNGDSETKTWKNSEIT